ncbi:MarC family protein [Myxococcus sp. AS-1-15]|jgi:multiple antibiotic resistance protein|uniref:MarC family protein n=1 Tax=Myxococcus TaxID=32 RepID=UPI001CBD3796|nr:MarC family protein [Myxococcus sp. AS-1-15]MBZ4397666.1 MarC family protein [Myxococcus sp. AS-1-15]BDT31609.1 MarC family protein [Myxococcus sp. MH1]
MPSFENPLLMFLSLFALYSPLAAVSSYFPIVSQFKPAEQVRLALGLFTYVAIFAMVALWVGEPLLELLGLSTAALTVTGGIALLYVGVPLMRGVEDKPPDKPTDADESKAEKAAQSGSWRSVLFMPVTFPLTVGGTTFAILVSFRAQAERLLDVVALSIAALAYAAVTGLTVFISGHIERRVTPKTRTLLERIAGILLTAIAVSLLASGAPQMVVETLNTMKK